MIIRILICLYWFSLYTFRAHAQTYEPGFLVRSTGDTLRGEIENDFWVESPAFIRFRPNSGAPGQLFKPHQLRMVQLTGGRYFRYEGLPIDHAAETRLDHLPRGYHPNVKIDSVLAEVLVEGPASLMRVGMFSATHYLLRRDGQSVLDLSERSYLAVNVKGNQEIRDGNNYRGQLEIFFGDCPAADRAAQTATFTAEGLVSVVQAYNRICSPTQQPGTDWLAQASPRRQLALQAGVLAGGRYFGTISFNKQSGQLNPFGGVYMEVLFPNRSLANYNELSVGSFRGIGNMVSHYVQTPVIVDGNTILVQNPVYSYFTYWAAMVTAQVGMRFYFQQPREQQLIVGVGLETRQLILASFTTSSGPTVKPSYSELNRGQSLTPAPTISVGWRWKRLTASLDAQRRVFRLSTAYRITRNTDEVVRQP